MVSGMRIWPGPPSETARASSSTKNGLPSALARIVRATSSGTPPDGQHASSTRRLSAGSRAWSDRCVAYDLSAQGRTCPGRQVTITRMLAPTRLSTSEARKAADAESIGRLPGGLDRVTAPWFTLPTVELGSDKEKQKGKEGEQVAAGLMLGLGERLVEKAVGKPLYQEVRLMMNLIVRPDAVAAAEAAAVQRFEQTLAGGRGKSREQLTMEIATKLAELNTIRLLRPLPVGPGRAGAGVTPVSEPARPLP